MKKVWYLENKNNDQAKTAKLFLYDKNGIVEAWLDLSSFAGVRNQPDWEIVFFSSDGKEIGRISYASGENEDDFWQAAVSGKGRIGEDIAEKLRGHQRTLELVVRVDGEIFASENVSGAWFNSELRNEKNAPSQLNRTEHEKKGYVDDAKESFDKVDLGNPDVAKSNLSNSNSSGVDWNPDMNEADLDESDMNGSDLDVNDMSQTTASGGWSNWVCWKMKCCSVLMCTIAFCCTDITTMDIWCWMKKTVKVVLVFRAITMKEKKS